MNSLTKLLLSILEESGMQCCVDTTRDHQTITSRVEDEGLSFLTITLPSFYKDLQRALDQGRVTADLFTPFKRVKGSELPSFLGGFLRLVFREGDGGLIHDGSDMAREDYVAIQAMFQITGLLSKVELECAPKRVAAAKARYIQNDMAVRENDNKITSEMISEFTVMAHTLFGGVFRRVSNEIRDYEIIPKHGPGAVADRNFGNAKWIQSNLSWPDKLESVFPSWRYAYSSGSIYLDENLSGRLLPGTEIPVKVITVPKTLKTPRIIAVEPTAMQYMQQGLLRSFTDAFNRFTIGTFLNGDSQVPNQRLAREGSLKNGESATLDLSDASDLVSNLLVQTMVKDFPLLGEALYATRSEYADVDGQVIRLAKYASMGSATCFPIEAIVFTIIVFLGLHDAYPTIRRQSLMKEFVGRVRIFGDDIIVPKRAAQMVVRRLEAFGLRVNRSKSFWTGMYRESCGAEYFNGSNVSIVRCKRVLPTRPKARSKEVDSILSTSALRNNLYYAGYHRTAEWLDSILLDVLDGHYPYVSSTSPAIGRISDAGFQTDKMSPDLQVPLVRAFGVKGTSPVSKLDGPGALMKTLSTDRKNPIRDEQHLERAGRPRLRMKIGWYRVY